MTWQKIGTRITMVKPPLGQCEHYGIINCEECKTGRFKENLNMINTINKIPTGEHWAIITEKSIVIPGDERSRTNPGHGYPESIEKFLEYEAFDNEKAFETEMKNCAKRSYINFRGIHVSGSYTLTTEVKMHKEYNEKH